MKPVSHAHRFEGHNNIPIVFIANVNSLIEKKTLFNSGSPEADFIKS